MMLLSVLWIDKTNPGSQDWLYLRGLLTQRPPHVPIPAKMGAVIKPRAGNKTSTRQTPGGEERRGVLYTPLEKGLKVPDELIPGSSGGDAEAPNKKNGFQFRCASEQSAMNE